MISSVNTQSPEDAKADLVKNHLAFAKNASARAAQSLPIEVSDAIQVGYEGLLKAAQRFDIEKYDPTQGSLETHFRAFVYPRIVGSVIDYARRDNFVRRRGLEKGLEFKFESLDSHKEIDGITYPDVQVEATYGDADLKLDFENALECLTERERFVMMALAAGVRCHEIGEDLGVSESRVSQIASVARAKLRERLEGYDL